MTESNYRTQEHARTIPLDNLGDELLVLLEGSEESGVADAVDLALSQGAYHGASDLHLEPWADALSLRYRLDGILQQVAAIPKEYQPKIIARIKVLSELVVYRKDVPQDGRIDRDKTTCARAMRVSTVPTIRGEKTVIRLLGETADLYHVDTLGFQQHVLDKLREIIIRTQGTLILTGPSSSGKTTTIYSLLQELMVLQKNTTNIVTIEDPVEYNMEHIAQIQTNPHVEFTFASALRAILRQDPEIIMVGEIRDSETARMAIQSGLTGHFVISTVHSGTACGVFTRLLDMGIEPFLVASSLSGVLAQRLIRLNCSKCAEQYAPDPILLKHFGLTKSDGPFYKGKGCEDCKGIGYRGRASVGELLQVDQFIAERVLDRPTTAQLHAIAVEQGMETLESDALQKAQKGITSIEELFRILPYLSN
jgi:type IV pilus assembly protein PilB